MKPIAFMLAAVVASGAIAQDRETHNLNAATADLAVFHELARDGVLRREDVQADLDFAPRFDEADTDRNRLLTAAEMDQYIERTYGISASSAGSERVEDAYRLHAATRDLGAYYQLAPGGTLRREDAQAHPVLGPRFDQADFNRDGVITAQEMDRYVRVTYGIVATTAPAASGSASVGSGGTGNPGSAAGGPERAGNPGSASAGGSRR